MKQTTNQPQFPQSLFFQITLPLQGLFIAVREIANVNFNNPFAGRNIFDKKQNPFKIGLEDEVDRLAKLFVHIEKDLHIVYLDSINDLKNAAKGHDDTYDVALQEWLSTLELDDHKMEKKHISRVTKYIQEFARYMGISEPEIITIRRGAFLHDIGKMGIPHPILKKKFPLSRQERDIMRQHPTYGYTILRPVKYLKDALDIPYCHHERWDGSGYPRGLEGTAIPLSARIFSVLDVWDAMTNHQLYREAWPQEEVLAYIRSSSGHQFDPYVVEKFLEWFETKNFELKGDNQRLGQRAVI
jgi:HD-GYP domain-containing protein (c-di-GMP phosphodiesterase class II)